MLGRPAEAAHLLSSSSSALLLCSLSLCTRSTSHLPVFPLSSACSRPAGRCKSVGPWQPASCECRCCRRRSAHLRGRGAAPRLLLALGGDAQQPLALVHDARARLAACAQPCGRALTAAPGHGMQA